MRCFLYFTLLCGTVSVDFSAWYSPASGVRVPASVGCCRGRLEAISDERSGDIHAGARSRSSIGSFAPVTALSGGGIWTRAW